MRQVENINLQRWAQGGKERLRGVLGACPSTKGRVLPCPSCYKSVMFVGNPVW